MAIRARASLAASPQLVTERGRQLLRQPDPAVVANDARELANALKFIMLALEPTASSDPVGRRSRPDVSRLRHGIEQLNDLAAHPDRSDAAELILRKLLEAHALLQRQCARSAPRDPSPRWLSLFRRSSPATKPADVPPTALEELLAAVQQKYQELFASWSASK